MSDEGSTTYTQPGNLRIRLGLFWVSNYFGGTDQLVLRRSEEMLSEHGLGLDLWPSRTRTDQSVLQFGDRLVEREDYDSLRSRAAAILSDAGKDKYLPVLFCQFRYTANGLTVWDTQLLCWVIPMCLVSPTVAGDNVTLLHEVGHAAGLGHDKTSTDPKSRNFMHEAETRKTMMKWQIQKMANAFYATP